MAWQDLFSYVSLKPLAHQCLTIRRCMWQSILAYIKQTADSRRRPRLSTEMPCIPKPTPLPRGRDLHAQTARMLQTRHDWPNRSSEHPQSSKSPRASFAHSDPWPTLTPPPSSQGSETPSPEESQPQGPGPSSGGQSQESADEVVSSLHELQKESVCAELFLYTYRSQSVMGLSQIR